MAHTCTGAGALLLVSPTCADHTRILIVVAVVPYPASVGTALQRVLPAGAAHFIHQDGACACSKVASARGTQRTATAQEAADNSGVLDIPAVIAYSSPCSLMPHLQPALTAVSSTYQAQRQVCRGRDVSGSGQVSIVDTISGCHLQWDPSLRP